MQVLYNRSKYGILILLLLVVVFPPMVKGQNVSINFSDTEYQDIFETLGELGGLSVLIDSSVTGKGTIQLKDTSFLAALDLVSRLSGYEYSLTEDTLLVAAKERLEAYQKQELYYIYTTYINPESIVDALSLMIPRENIHVQQDNLVILSGTAEDLAAAQELIKKLDRPDRSMLQAERSVIEILQQLTKELGLDLIATPSLSEIRLVVDVWQMEPMAVIDLLEDLANIKVVITDDTLIATSVADVDLVEPERIKVYWLNYTEPATASNILEFILPSEKIRVDQTSKSVTILANQTQIAQADQFIAEFDQPLPQVLLEVWIQEMSADAFDSFGIEWSTTFDGFTLKEGSGTNHLFDLTWKPWEIAFALRALEEQGKVKVLASPKIATLSGEEASIFVGDRVPLILRDVDDNERIEFLESGIDLKVLPWISADGYITIAVTTEVSTFSFIEGDNYPHIRTREADTIIRVKDGQAVLIGGLLQEQEVESINKIPILADLPVLGKLFTRTNKTAEQTEMNIFLIPRIVDGSEGLVSSSFFTGTQ